MTPIDLNGHTYFRDRQNEREMKNRLALQVDLKTTAFVVGGFEDQDVEELVFNEPEVRRAMEQVVDAMRRHAYRRRPITAVPKPQRHRCDVCDGRRVITNSYSGEVFQCPVCG